MKEHTSELWESATIPEKVYVNGVGVQVFIYDENEVVQAVACDQASARHIVACVNILEGIPTDKIEGKNLAELVASQTMLTGMGPDSRGGFGIQLEGGACHLLAESFADQFKSSGAVNYLEVNFVHKELGDISVTMQRTSGKTPGQMKAEAVAQRDELLAALKNAVECEPDACFAESARAAIAKCEAQS